MRIIVAAFAAFSLALPAAAQSPGDALRGAQVYEERCTGCHSLDANRVGPAHRGVHGRKAGSAAGFGYSPALKRARIVWGDATLDLWLQGPQAMIPGARMGFQLGDAQARADVIAYLKQESARKPG